MNLIDCVDMSKRSQAICKSRHRYLSINIAISLGIVIGIAKKLFCLAQSFLPFEVLCEENIHGEVLLNYTC